jgi:hypothetical protein
MIGKHFGKKKFSSRGRYIRSSSDILPNWNDIRSSYIPPKRNDMRSIADIPKINKISPLTLRNFAYLADMRFSSLIQMPSALRISTVPLTEIGGKGK